MERTNLKVFRTKQKLSQEEFAKKIGYVRATYSAVESGKRDGSLFFWRCLQLTFNIPDSEMWELMKKGGEE